MQHLIEKARAIKLVIFDVDGVLTDGSLFFGDDGQEYKAFNSKDGHGIRMLLENGIETAIITARESNVVTLRMENLSVPYVLQGRRQKLPAYAELKQLTAIDDHEIAYIGDDVIDLAVMQQVGLAVAVQDAHPFVKQHAHWVTPSCGGHGAARDLSEMILDAKGLLAAILESYRR